MIRTVEERTQCTTAGYAVCLARHEATCAQHTGARQPGGSGDDPVRLRRRRAFRRWVDQHGGGSAAVAARSVEARECSAHTLTDDDIGRRFVGPGEQRAQLLGHARDLEWTVTHFAPSE